MATLTLHNLSKHFGRVKAVDNISLSVQDAEFVCLLGPSGCGKSTALRLVAGFEEPTSGDILIDGVSVANLPPNKRPTAMVFQKYTLWPHMRVYDNIAFGLRLRGLSKAEVDRKVREALELVGMADYGPRYPSQLSGGQQQRVALARALVLEPKILLLDEPFSSLDAILRVRLREELRRIQRQLHITAIFVTHDQEEALSLADRIAVINSGQIEQVDTPGVIYDNPQTLFVADFIGAMNLLPAEIRDSQLLLADRAFPAPQGAAGGKATVAIRPEDIVLLAPTSDESGTWPGAIEQVMDLGYYRKTLVQVPGVGSVKVYLPKAATVQEGENVKLYPTRYMVYHDGGAPVEVKRAIGEGMMALR